MPRKAWFRAFDGWWYCQVGDKQIKLAKGKRNKSKAIGVLRQIQAQNPKATPAHLARVTVAQLSDAFLSYSAATHDPETTDWFRRFLGQFCREFGHLKPHSIKEDLVMQWLNAEKRIRRGKKKDGSFVYRTIRWSSSTKNAAARSVTQLLNWALKRGLITENPLKFLKKPPMRRRQRILSGDERKAILGAARDRQFKMYLYALGSTGARPGEIREVTAAHFREPGLWVFEDHKTADRTGQPRIVFLTPPLIKLCRRLMRENPDGPIFRTESGEPWTRQSVRMRLRTIQRRLKLDAGVCAYAYRHTWITNALVSGVDSLTVAELAGHTGGTRMIEQHYSHLARMVDFMQQQAIKANGHGRARTRPRDNSPGTSEDRRP